LLMKSPNLKAITGLRNRCMLELMYRAGLRVSEVCNLKNRDVKMADGEIRVWDSKGGDRTTYYAEGTPLDALLPLWLDRKKKETTGSEYFFCTIKGGPCSSSYMEQMIRRMAKRAKLTQRVTPHMLRHTFATEALEDGVSIKQVQEALGHKNLATTEVYLHVRPETLKKALRRRPTS